MTNKAKIIRCCLLVCILCMIVFGLLRGEAAEICAKAVKICLECIGIG